MSYISRSYDGTVLPDIETITGDVGGAVGPDGAFNIDILGGTNMGTVGAPGANSITINLNDSVSLAGTFSLLDTNAAGTAGVIYIGGERWIHNYGDITNTFVGADAGNFTLTAATARGNTGIGRQSLQDLTTGFGNTGIGENSGRDITTGDYNSAIGYSTLVQLTTGSWNTVLGRDAGDALTLGDSSNICISHGGVAGSDNVIRIGTQGNGAGQQDTCYIAGIYNVATGATGGVVTIDNGHQLGSSNGANGQVLIGGGTAPVWANITSTGGTVDITNGAGSINLEISGGVEWTEATGATQALAVNTGYILNRGAGVTATLPAAAAIGDVIKIVGKLGLFVIAQNGGQTIHMISSSTTTGVGGSVTATTQYDCLELVCITANTDFVIRNSMGNLTIA